MTYYKNISTPFHRSIFVFSATADTDFSNLTGLLCESSEPVIRMRFKALMDEG